MSDRPVMSGGDTGQPSRHTRREFIRRVLLTTAYAAPAIVSLTVTGVAHGKNDSRGRGRGSPMSPMSPMRMMSPMAMNTMMHMGNAGDMWK